MSIHVVVTRAFGDYKRGALITGPEAEALLAGEHAHDVVRSISHLSHLSGDFFRTDAELMAKNGGKMPEVVIPAASRPAVSPRVVDRSR